MSMSIWVRVGAREVSKLMMCERICWWRREVARGKWKAVSGHGEEQSSKQAALPSANSKQQPRAHVIAVRHIDAQRSQVNHRNHKVYWDVHHDYEQALRARAHAPWSSLCCNSVTSKSCLPLSHGAPSHESFSSISQAAPQTSNSILHSLASLNVTKNGGYRDSSERSGPSVRHAIRAEANPFA